MKDMRIDSFLVEVEGVMCSAQFIHPQLHYLMYAGVQDVRFIAKN